VKAKDRKLNAVLQQGGRADARSLGGLAEVGEDTLNCPHVGHERRRRRKARARERPC
jgi:hypothetical protein